MKNVKTFLKENKTKIIYASAVLAVGCIGSFVGAKLGVNSAFADSKLRIDLYASDGTHLGHVN